MPRATIGTKEWRSSVNRKNYLRAKSDPKKWKHLSERHYFYKVKRNYGITKEAVLALYDAQRGLCAICESALKTPPSAETTVDHDHKTGRVRGLLCRSCNRALGFFDDRADRMLKAAAYVS